ncbi:MAG TPA: DNA-directed RNA polymerase subunit omega [Armatimonadetes bacterium]|nr:DNA-directed RNA polymerase subunit omega [Armatimonadota bacterium]
MRKLSEFDLIEQVGSKYALVVAVANRARQLNQGATPLVETKSDNPVAIALEEIAAGKLKVEFEQENEEET